MYPAPKDGAPMPAPGYATPVQPMQTMMYAQQPMQPMMMAPGGYGQQPMVMMAPGMAPYGMAAPPQQVMVAEHVTHILESVPGVVIKQTTQIGNAILTAIGAAFELNLSFEVKALPQHGHAAREHNEPGLWTPTAMEINSLPQLALIQEESPCCERFFLAWCGGLNLRALKLHVTRNGREDIYVDRPCKLGGFCCCPLEMSVYQGQGRGAPLLGKVVEDFDCIQQCCECVFTHGVYDARMQKKYALRTGLACCGRVDNCCGATCCKYNLIMDVLSPSGELVSTVQKTWGPGPGACCRGLLDFDNYVVQFPQAASGPDRALLVVAVMSQEYALFSRRGGDSNN